MCKQRGHLFFVLPENFDALQRDRSTPSQCLDPPGRSNIKGIALLLPSRHSPSISLLLLNHHHRRWTFRTHRQKCIALLLLPNFLSRSFSSSLYSPTLPLSRNVLRTLATLPFTKLAWVPAAKRTATTNWWLPWALNSWDLENTAANLLRLRARADPSLSKLSILAHPAPRDLSICRPQPSRRLVISQKAASPSLGVSRLLTWNEQFFFSFCIPSLEDGWIFFFSIPYGCITFSPASTVSSTTTTFSFIDSTLIHSFVQYRPFFFFSLSCNSTEKAWIHKNIS